LQSEKPRSTKFKIKREFNITKTEWKKNNLLKRLHGESKQEAIFQRKYKLQSSKKRFSSLVDKIQKALFQPIRKLRKKLSDP